jgi:selenocysteine-specific elongation factor
MPVIGTAGHVDHGKSTLIEALTGRNPDRLAEERRRGLTIDLGFAWTALADGTPVGFVDVPGHERFIKNMLAGIEVVQGVLFVVAADEGWMPQSEEHLAIIDLLEQRNGVVALSRRDLVDDDTAALATLEVEEALAGTSLAGSPIIEVSPPTGLGIEELRHELGKMVGRVTSSGRPRMWIDRSFTIAGSGTVVTGTLSGGSISTGDEIAIWPGPVTARVRGLQSHEQTVDSAVPGSRTAMNLGGVGLDAINRGSMAGRPGEWQPTDVFLASLRAARGMDDALADRGAYHLHAGSGAWPMRLRRVGEDAALIRVAEAVPLAMGDRFIVRDVGRRAVIGGGRVLDPAPRGRPSPAAIGVLRAALDGPDVGRANALVELRGRAVVSTVAAHSGAVPSGLTTIGETVFSDTEVAEIRRSALATVAAFHAANPLRPGMPSASLAERLGLEVEQLTALIGGDLIIETSYVREVDFDANLDAAHQEAQEMVRKALTESGLAVPRASQLGISLELRHALERKGVLARVDDDLVYLPEQIEQMKGVIAGLEEGFTVSEFRDACGISRRQAVPVLEWFDRTGLTERFGDRRRLRKS